MAAATVTPDTTAVSASCAWLLIVHFSRKLDIVPRHNLYFLAGSRELQKRNGIK